MQDHPEELSFLKESGIETSLLDNTSPFIAAKLGVDLEAERALEEQIGQFKQHQQRQIQRYLEEARRHRTKREDYLLVMNGSAARSTNPENCPYESLRFSQKSYGGIFIRWNGKGIVFNPGTHFLEHLHRQGLYITDIDHVVVTQCSSELNAHVKKLYDFNYQLNKVNPELHVINYHLHHKAYQGLSHTLKPNFKQERNTVHSLELFLDSPDIEGQELAEGIVLNYFSTSARAGYQGTGEFHEMSRSLHQPSGIGLRIDLFRKGREAGSSVRIGYLSGAAWSPLLSHHLGLCDILIAGFGSTHASDYGKLHYNENCLGYYGTYTLLEEVQPKYLLCTEFDGHEGDIRLEVVRKMRREFENAHPSQDIPAILPVDNGFLMDLKTQQVECSVTKKLFDPANIVVVKGQGPHGPLRYLASTCIL